MTKKLRLYGAAMMAVKIHFELNEPFSAHDITTFIRDKVDTAEWELWNGGDAGTVKHSTIRGYINEMKSAGLFYGDYDTITQTATNGAVYKQYIPLTDNDINSFADEAEQDFEDALEADSIFTHSVSVNDVRVDKLSDGSVAVHAPNGDCMVF